MSKNGFTLIELLISISIIAILSALGLIAYTAVLQQGRDAKRQSDLKSIQSALEQYNSDQGFYPLDLTGLTNGRKYLNSIPSDPITTTSRAYRYGPNLNATTGTVECDNKLTVCTRYVMCALFEVTPTTNPSGCDKMNCASGKPCNGGVSPP